MVRGKVKNNLPSNHEVEHNDSKKKCNPFIDEMVVVDDNDDDMDDIECEDDFIEEEDGDKSSWITPPNDRLKFERTGETDEQLAMFYDKKYGRYNNTRANIVDIPQPVLLPHNGDPDLFFVKCKPGKETEIVLNLMRRYLNHKNSSQPFEALSAFSRTSLKGCLYVEAYRKSHVQEILQHVPHVFIKSLSLIPFNDRVNTISIHNKKLQIPLESWVRIKHGVFTGDLAQVIQTPDSQDNVCVKVIPRLPTSKRAEGRNEGRPRQSKFNPETFANRSDITKKGSYWFYDGNCYRDGYLEKFMKVSALQTEDVNPTFDEISCFLGNNSEHSDNASQSNINLCLFSNPVIHHNTHASDIFQSGDTVTVVEGELINLWSTVDSANDTSVTVTLNQHINPVTLPAKHLCKRFNEGDHVKIINGRYKSETGMVLRTHNNIVALLSDVTMKELRVFAKDVRQSQDIAPGSISIGKYELHDLVQLDFNTVGVIVNVNYDSFKILTQNGNELTVYPNQITCKKDTYWFVTADKNGSRIRDGDNVIEISSNRACSVLHIFRNIVFLYSREKRENNGVSVANRIMIRRELMLDDSFKNKNKVSFYRNRGSTTPIGRVKDGLTGRTIRILDGLYKGYVGIVKYTTYAKACVELHTNSKILNVEKSKLMIVDSRSNENRDDHIHSLRPHTPARHISLKTPVRTMNTPSATPIRNINSHTPAWDTRSVTPNLYSNETSLKDFRDPFISRTPISSSMDTVHQHCVSQVTHQTNFNRDSNQLGSSTSYSNVTSKPVVLESEYTGISHKTNNACTDQGYDDEFNWPIENIKALLRKDYGGLKTGEYVNIAKVDNSSHTCLVEFMKNDSVNTSVVPFGSIEPMMPNKKDTVMVIHGEDRGKIGYLIGIDSGDGIVKMKKNNNFRIFNLNSLAKYIGTECWN